MITKKLVFFFQSTNLYMSLIDQYNLNDMLILFITQWDKCFVKFCKRLKLLANSSLVRKSILSRGISFRLNCINSISNSNVRINLLIIKKCLFVWIYRMNVLDMNSPTIILFSIFDLCKLINLYIHDNR